MNIMDGNGKDERAADRQGIRAKRCEWPMYREYIRKVLSAGQMERGFSH